MVGALFDTNILLDFLAGDRRAIEELRRVDQRFISVVGWMEVMVGVPPWAEAFTRTILDDLHRIMIDDAISERAVEIRRKHRIKLPDAIIWATAQTHDLLLVTRNTKDFPPGTEGVRVPYAI